MPRFRAPRFDPDAWASLAQRAGAKYIVPVAEHHDGVALLRAWVVSRVGVGVRVGVSYP